jgi:hypothetical protein
VRRRHLITAFAPSVSPSLEPGTLWRPGLAKQHFRAAGNYTESNLARVATALFSKSRFPNWFQVY